MHPSLRHRMGLHSYEGMHMAETPIPISEAQSKVERLRSVIERTGLSKSELYRRIRDCKFPQPVSLGARAVGWRRADIDAWIGALQKRGAQ